MKKHEKKASLNWLANVSTVQSVASHGPFDTQPECNSTEYNTSHHRWNPESRNYVLIAVSGKRKSSQQVSLVDVEIGLNLVVCTLSCAEMLVTLTLIS